MSKENGGGAAKRASQLNLLTLRFCSKRPGSISGQREILAFFLAAGPCGRAGKASPILERAARRNLAIGLHNRIGGFFRVVGAVCGF